MMIRTGKSPALRAVAVALCALMIFAAVPARVFADDGAQSIKVTVTGATAKSIRFRWSSVRGATGYTVSRAYSKHGRYTTIRRCGRNRSCRVKGLDTKKDYFYRVTASTPNGIVRSKPIRKARVMGYYNIGSPYAPYYHSSNRQIMYVRDKVANFVNCKQVFNYSYEKRARLANDYEVRYLDYYAPYKASDAYYAFRHHKANCYGYAMMYMALCNGSGLKCRTVHASKKSTVPMHMWDCVRLNGRWYFVDPTANDYGLKSGDMVYLAGRKDIDRSYYRWVRKKYPKISYYSYDCERAEGWDYF